MHDLKNILLAWVSSVSAVFTAIEGREVITIVSAIVLPAVFFAVGKAVDVAVQFYFRLREERKKSGGTASQIQIVGDGKTSLFAHRGGKPQGKKA
ncbi:MAG: hypothetical protein ABI878_06260 [Acidobacteriota bacterium]